MEQQIEINNFGALIGSIGYIIGFILQIYGITSPLGYIDTSILIETIGRVVEEEASYDAEFLLQITLPNPCGNVESNIRRILNRRNKSSPHVKSLVKKEVLCIWNSQFISEASKILLNEQIDLIFDVLEHEEEVEKESKKDIDPIPVVKN
ncbi:unnamed protein product [Lepeophtheirus salmonis]|uniref:(salmon louse) hypothetical protein n=1 Tax=Lepeophtheirus salmonis TaxID=72036 RepID=A0A7R8CVI6_LEPSM|nr:unnamed protein product [Lepeophtheirus salmonis]CAF2945160.1 unnamed protein product [Lepeophtheirus salmonis]